MDNWQHALTEQVASTIEYHRALRRLSRSELAARCTALGLPTKRPALAALLDGRRQTVTLQELIVLAEALDTPLAELIVPLHTGDQTVSGPDRTEHALPAAERLFASRFDGARGAEPYTPFVRYRNAAERFTRANRRLAELSHALATGAAETNETDGRPHPASEILAAEASLSRLVDSAQNLQARGLRPPPPAERCAFLLAEERPMELPVLEYLPRNGADLLPLLVYRVQRDQLPTARMVSELPIE